MNIIWEILRKPIGSLTNEEFVVFALVILICLTFAGIALSTLVQLARKLERNFSTESASVKRSMERVGRLENLEERLGHTD